MPAPICNYLYWSALEHARNKPSRVVFVHVPLVHRPGERRRKGKLALDDLVRAGEAILLALVSAQPSRR